MGVDVALPFESLTLPQLDVAIGCVLMALVAVSRRGTKTEGRVGIKGGGGVRRSGVRLGGELWLWTL